MIFDDFTEEMTSINVAIYIGERRVGCWLKLAAGDSVNFAIFHDEVGEALQVIMNTHIAPFGGTVSIDVTLYA